MRGLDKSQLIPIKKYLTRREKRDRYKFRWSLRGICHTCFELLMLISERWTPKPLGLCCYARIPLTLCGWIRLHKSHPASLILTLTVPQVPIAVTQGLTQLNELRTPLWFCLKIMGHSNSWHDENGHMKKRSLSITFWSHHILQTIRSTVLVNVIIWYCIHVWSYLYLGTVYTCVYVYIYMNVYSHTCIHICIQPIPNLSFTFVFDILAHPKPTDTLLSFRARTSFVAQR